MYNRVYRYQLGMKGKQIYAQLECLECLQLTNKMLEDEVKLIVASRQKAEK
jgi:hypothetical protein